MPRRIDQYEVERGDNLGDPQYWNKKLEDIDLRLASLEDFLQNIDAVADRVEGAALDRINNVITPLVNQARDNLAAIPNLFTATSGSAVTVGVGQKTFTVIEQDRAMWAVTFGVHAATLDDPSAWMSGTLVSFDRTTGVLVLQIDDFEGAGQHTGWSFSIGGRRGLKGDTGATGLTPRGNYNPATGYVPGDGVQDQGASWVNTLASTGEAPPTLPTLMNANWQLVAAPGDDGEVSVAMLNAGLATKANVNHTQSISSITGLEAALGGKAAVSHGHEIGEVSGLAAALAGKESANGNLLKSNVSANLTKGYTTTNYDGGTWNTGSFKPAPDQGNVQRITNTGAFTFTAPTAAGDYTIIVKITNGAGAGAMTFQGFASVGGDDLTTTQGHKFFVYITKLDGDAAALVQALQ